MRESAIAWPECAAGSAALRLCHAVRPLGGPPPDGVPDAALAISVALGGAPVPAGLAAGTAFLVDALHRAVERQELARTIGCLAVFLAAEGGGPAEVTLGAEGEHDGEDDGEHDGRPAGTARVRRAAFEAERTGFGAAHILHESPTLGLYVLEVAPGAAIPAHFHRVMQEAELVLDPGLLLQGRPVDPGAAFVWPPGRVHAYANPGRAPRRILCIDRPKFIPEDEIVVAGPVALAPARPARSYRI